MFENIMHDKMCPPSIYITLSNAFLFVLSLSHRDCTTIDYV